jgi:hypothetical protein
MRKHSTVSLLCVLLGMGCSQSASKTTSTLSGTAALSTFPAAPVAATAIDETGRAVAAPVGPDGHFTFTLTKGHLYTLSLASTDAEVPVVLPRASGALRLSFRLSTGGARLDLGSVRYFASAPQGGFHISTAPATAGSGPDEECVDGLLAGTSTPCVDDDGKVTCDDGAEVDDGDGECENGKDARTGAPCTDPPESGAVADPSSAIAVPDRTVPDDVSGCSEDDGEDGETNDD